MFDEMSVSGGTKSLSIEISSWASFSSGWVRMVVGVEEKLGKWLGLDLGVEMNVRNLGVGERKRWV